jgi:hypothetical protein
MVGLILSLVSYIYAYQGFIAHLLTLPIMLDKDDIG